MIELRSHFHGSDHYRLREWHRRQHLMEQSRRDDQARREGAADELESDLLTAASTILATPQEIEAFAVKLDEFEARLDTYDKATVKALLESQQRLEAFQHQREAMLRKAYVMDDGRRAFRSEDGLFYIDENRNTVDPSNLDLSRFTDVMPSAEAFIENEDNILREEALQQEIHEFDAAKDRAQDRGKEIRAEIEKGSVTKERLDELSEELNGLDKDLMQVMPSAVRTHVSAFGLDTDKPDMKAGFEDATASGVASSAILENHHQPGLVR